MKQITPGLREKIFALYWLQGVLKYTECDDTYTNWLEHWRLENKGTPYLELKPLSSITDEDAIEVAKIYSDNPEYHKADRAKQKLFAFYENHWNALPVDTADLLRSKGYALPAYGFSVDELVEAGVFKLKEE